MAIETDQPEVRLHELALGVLALAHEPLEVALLGAGEALVDGVEGLPCGLAGLDVLGEAGFVVLGQQLVPADVFQIQTNEILVVPFSAVSYSSHGAFPRGWVAVARGRERPSTVERRGMRPCSGSLPEIRELADVPRAQCRGGGPSIVHLFGYPTHIHGSTSLP